jgi:DNA mismatch repair protein MutL
MENLSSPITPALGLRKSSMASKIHILQPDLANKIAAGEVVNRPASVVKELAENALDANATRITVIIKDAGKALIQVSDNGDGMGEEDATLAFARHATSKISSADDLEHIHTFGFRGEALASVAAVSHVELRTRTAHEDVGTCLKVEASEIKERSKYPMEQGTSVLVKNLFYNTPARRNFLKSRQTELKNITDVVTRMAIAYPEVEWQYISDDETFLDLKAKPIEQRLTDVLGEKHFASLVKMHESTDYVTIDGFIGKPDFARKVRVDQFVYLNRRFIQSRMINHAVFHGYEHILEKGAYPFFILNLTLDPQRVDVNVHPSKLEVKFENESNIYRMILSVVRKTLAVNNLVPSVSFRSEEGGVDSGERLGFQQNAPENWRANRMEQGRSAGPGLTELDRRDFGGGGEKGAFERLFDAASMNPPASQSQILQQAPDIVVEHTSVPEQTMPDGTVGNRAIWQIHNKYIFSQVRSGVMIVDQHAAHERILYERVLANFKNSLPTSQQLLFPQTIELGASDYLLLKDLMPHMERLGFDVRLFGKNTVIIDGIPGDVRIGNERKILEDLLDEYRNNEHATTTDVRDNLAKSFACKAAIKSGDRLTPAEMLSLIDTLFLTQTPYVCPHGRPTMVKVSTDELDRRFGRTG